MAKHGKNHSPHHIIPTSRQGDGSEFNMYSWTIKRHQAWHFLFRNLTTFEVWEIIDQIHSVIFCAEDHDAIDKLWLRGCPSKGGADIVERPVTAKRLRIKWVECFGNEDIATARLMIKRILLVSIFGARAEKRRFYLDEHYLAKVISKIDSGTSERRVAAFNIVFGDNRNVDYIQKKIAKLLEHSRSSH